MVTSTGFGPLVFGSCWKTPTRKFIFWNPQSHGGLDGYTNGGLDGKNGGLDGSDGGLAGSDGGLDGKNGGLDGSIR